jgi:hypothetical protein
MIEGVDPWYVITHPNHSYGNGHGLFADALIDAEIEGWEPPAPPPQAALSAEELHAAIHTWQQMVREHPPMPPHIALDCVQNDLVGGERSRAVYALHQGAADWLDRLRPEQPVEGEAPSTSLNIAISVRGHMLGASYDLSESCIAELEELNYETGRSREIRNGREFSAAWLNWCGDARRAIELCRAVSAAATSPASAA